VCLCRVVQAAGSDQPLSLGVGPPVVDRIEKRRFGRCLVYRAAGYNPVAVRCARFCRGLAVADRGDEIPSADHRGRDKQHHTAPESDELHATFADAVHAAESAHTGRVAAKNKNDGLPIKELVDRFLGGEDTATEQIALLLTQDVSLIFQLNITLKVNIVGRCAGRRGAAGRCGTTGAAW